MFGTFAGKAVLITGASRGIGRELALQLAAAGARLGLVARSIPDLEGAARDCRQAGAEAIVAPADVALEHDCRRAVTRIVSEFGGLDLLVLNAGISMLSRFEDLRDASALEQVMQVNYFGSVYCALYALPELYASRGQIVAVSSLTGLTGVPTRTGYAASKHAMRGFFDSLRIEVARHGVGVTVVYPGFVDTGIRQRAVGEGTGRRESESGRNVMSAQRCAQLILRAAARRRREVVLTGRGKLGLWMRLVAPSLVDAIASRAVGFRP